MPDDLYSAPEGEGLQLLREDAHSGDQPAVRNGLESLRLGMQLSLDAMHPSKPLDPMQHLYNAYSIFHTLSMIDKKEDDELYQQALRFLRGGIDALNAEATL